MDLNPLHLPYSPDAPIVIAGPCAAESEEQMLDIAVRLSDMGVKIMRAGAWKPRTKPGSFEGYGKPALAWMKAAKAATGMMMTTEVANADHVEAALEAGIDILWIGARTATNPFAVQQIADALRGTDSIVMVKNPVSPDVDLWIGALERLNQAGIKRLAAIHRGFLVGRNTGYRNAPIWRIPIELRRRLPELPIICDPSHIGGQRQLIAPLSAEAMNLGFDGLMIECHTNPDEALSDSQQQITPDRLHHILASLDKKRTTGSDDEIDTLRLKIDDIDNELLHLVAQRMEVSRDIGEIKQRMGMTVLQSARYSELLDKRINSAEPMQLSRQFIARLFADIHEESVRQQLELTKNK